jgi:hypothetical protein
MAIQAEWQQSVEKNTRYLEGLRDHHDATTQIRPLKYPSTPPIPYTGAEGLFVRPEVLVHGATIGFIEEPECLVTVRVLPHGL